MTLDEEERRGHEAERIMNEPLVKEAFAEMERALTESLRRADLNNTDILRTITANIQVLHGFQRLLRDTMETGKMARIQKQTIADRLLRRKG